MLEHKVMTPPKPEWDCRKKEMEMSKKHVYFCDYYGTEHCTKDCTYARKIIKAGTKRRIMGDVML